MGRKRSRFGEELVEECCFECKDGGDGLLVCGYMNCLKSYHPDCTVKKQGDDFPPGQPFICNWHACVNCRKSPDYQCLCCPNHSVCQSCIGRVKFFKMGKQNKGLCGFCFRLAISVEKKAADPRANSNYQDSDTGALLFKDYWNAIKDRECLTLVDLQEASVLYRGLNCTREADSEKFPVEDLLGDSNGIEQKLPSDLKSKPDKINTSVKRKKSKRKTYDGWGTKELIEFLSCFGKDTKDPLAEAEVVGVVKEYIKQKGLFLEDKKKYFECDYKLRPLFTRKKVRYNLLHSKLRMHLAANSASEDESLDDSEDEDGPIMKKELQASLEPKIAKRVSERNKRCLASLNLDNINHIYLRRSVVSDLLKQGDTFKQKVVGCFVRVMNNTRSHIFQKSERAFQLGLVTDVKEAKEEYTVKDISTKLILCVAGFWGDVKITMLSDQNIQEEECKELIPLVEKGALQRATVAEFEEKVAAVHTDIVNHRINAELERLEKDIDLAHVQGWHDRMCKLMDRQKLLSTPAERQRLLEAVPEILADAEDEKQIEPKITADDPCQVSIGKDRERTACLVGMKENSKEATQPVADSFDILIEISPKGVAEHASESLEALKEKPPGEATQPVADSFEVLIEKSPKGVAEHASESLEVLKEKPPGGTTEQAVNVFNILNEETSEDATDQVADCLRVHEEESPEGAKKMVHSHSVSFNEKSSEGAFEQGDATHEVTSEAGEATSSGPLLHSPVYMAQAGEAASSDPVLHSPVYMAQAGEAASSDVTPNPVLHSPVYMSQDGSGTQAMDIDKDTSNHTKLKKGSKIPVHEVINLDDSDEEEDVHSPKHEVVHPPRAVNGTVHPPRAVSGTVHPPRAMNGVDLHKDEPELAWHYGFPPELHSPRWYYVDPQGCSRGPFQLIRLWEWYNAGYFGEGFKVWRIGQTKHEAILLTHAFRMIP